MEGNRFDDILARYKLPLAMTVVGVVLLSAGVVSSGIIPKTFVGPKTPGLKSVPAPSPASAQAAVPVSGTLTVDVSGAVQTPGVYKLPPGSRVWEAISAAGGFSPSADPVFVNKTLNQAQKISDGMKIYIPVAGESVPAGATTLSASAASGSVISGAFNGSAVVNLNTSSASELDSLPGVGTVTAQKIISNRPYGSVEDLLTKKVVGSSEYQKIKDRVSI